MRIFVRKLANMKEGESTVLDNSCILFMSNMWSGAKHDSTQVPILTAGSLGGTLETGPRVGLLQEGRTRIGNVCSFYMSLMNRMGVKINKFGDATTELAGV